MYPDIRCYYRILIKKLAIGEICIKQKFTTNYVH